MEISIYHWDSKDQERRTAIESMQDWNWDRSFLDYDTHRDSYVAFNKTHKLIKFAGIDIQAAIAIAGSHEHWLTPEAVPILFTT